MRASGVLRGDLIDTSALLALVRERDPWHDACFDALRGVTLPLVTTTAVLTELFHLVLKRKRDQQAAWRMLRNGRVQLRSMEQADLPGLEILMDRYADRPMDFADVVHVAEREGLKTILTIDHDDFETYRIGRNAKFRILPARTR
ncbi:MAG: PIN domain-containing protein [Alphaproteobacteria bacterium]|nr:MAG: PIN domain-containing protein [Alphaproteobacteria bacterium]